MLHCLKKKKKKKKKNGLHRVVCSMSDLGIRGTGFETLPGYIFSWKLIMKSFLRSFPPSTDSRKGSCQLLDKVWVLSNGLALMRSQPAQKYCG